MGDGGHTVLSVRVAYVVDLGKKWVISCRPALYAQPLATAPFPHESSEELESESQKDQ